MRLPRVRAAGLLLGVGLGGFLDGIVLHQIVQWHSMLSARLPTMESMDAMRASMAADGWFHMATWIVTLAGIVTLWSAARSPGPLLPSRAFAGWMLAGWGGFNLVEGVIDHQLLELHHVRDLPHHVPAYDWVFLALSAVIAAAGWLMARGSRASMLGEQ
jgi:uncharacterized membrane protein